MIYIGIDPGKSGALAIMNISKNSDMEQLTVKIPNNLAFVKPLYSTQINVMLFNAHDYTKALRDVAYLRDAGEQVAPVCVEKVGAMPNQGVVSMFSFGHNLGFIEGLLSAFNLSYQLVPPSVWKKEYSLNSDKTKSIEICQKLFPDVSLLPTPRCKKCHDGMAEALLMAEYARRKW